MSKPDIDDLLDDLYFEGFNDAADRNMVNDSAVIRAKQALYHRLAAEAVAMGEWDSVDSRPIQAIPLSKLKAIMEIKE